MKFTENFYDDIQIAQSYLFSKDFENFDDFWNAEIPERHNLSEESSEQQIYDNLNAFFIGLKPYLVQGAIDKLSEEGRDYLRDEVPNCGSSGILAARLLRYNEETPTDGCNNCSENFSPVPEEKVKIKDSIKDKKIEEVHLFPNPAKAKLTVQVPESHGKVTLKVFDLTGKLIHQAKAEYQYQFSTQELGNGVYFLKVIGEKNISTIHKFQIIH